MEHPVIDIDAVPLLDTAVGLFGTFANEIPMSASSVFEVGVTVVMIIYD